MSRDLLLSLLDQAGEHARGVLINEPGAQLTAAYVLLKGEPTP